MRVVIADDHTFYREGLARLLRKFGVDVVGEAPDGEAAVRLVAETSPDVVLLDLRMPGVSGLEAVRMLTVSRDNADVLESLRRGAIGYLLKDMNPASLPVAVRAALGGEGVLPRALSAGLIEEFRHRPGSRRVSGQSRERPALSAREWEILELLAEGAATADMAERLFLSQVTVRRHISSILSKLGVTSREEAARLVRGDDLND